MKFFALTTMSAFLISLFAVGSLMAAGEQESGKSRSQSASQMEQSGQQQSQQLAGAGQQLDSEQIRQVQQALQEKGANPGPVDGIMGPKTQQAIKQFQQDNGIAATGRLDSQTLQALEVQEFMGVSPAFGEREGSDIQQRGEGLDQEQKEEEMDQQQRGGQSDRMDQQQMDQQQKKQSM
jgi:hypothetical protein